ncbi:MAG: hypothetical protein EXS05_01300 [Planctomycetaceae bacterium]|nr:hypothetical protein [Planctomycetaceae bacterium]
MIRPTPTSVARRAAAVAFITAYLACTLWFAGGRLLGDGSATPAAYFFTWDMFLFHYTESLRRVAVGRTQSGKFVQLVPSGLLQYRGGVQGDLTRVDLDRAGGYYRAAVEHALHRAAATGDLDSIVHVELYEHYWPAKFNYPPEMYESWCGEPHPHRRYWRLREEFDVEQAPRNAHEGVAP